MIDSIFFTESIEDVYPFSNKAIPNFIVAYHGWEEFSKIDMDIEFSAPPIKDLKRGAGFLYMREVLYKVIYECYKIVSIRDRQTYHTMGGFNSYMAGLTRASGSLKVSPISFNNKEKFICTVKDVLTYNV